jgi:hypothetical protein
MTVDKIKIYKITGIALFIFIVIASGLTLSSVRSYQRAAIPASPERVSAADVSAIAFASAQIWSSDALLAYMNSGAVEQIGGRAETWEFIFVASSKKGKGYRVTILGHAITHKEEINYQGQGAPLPPSMLPEEEAIKRVRAMPGFEDVDILGVEAVHGPSGTVWYWGVKTSKGVVSVEAK